MSFGDIVTPPVQTTKKVVVVGGGIAGLGVCYYLLLVGFTDIHVYESHGKLGGLLATIRSVGSIVVEYTVRAYPRSYRLFYDMMIKVGGLKYPTRSYDVQIHREKGDVLLLRQTNSTYCYVFQVCMNLYYLVCFIFCICWSGLRILPSLVPLYRMTQALFASSAQITALRYKTFKQHLGPLDTFGTLLFAMISLYTAIVLEKTLAYGPAVYLSNGLLSGLPYFDIFQYVGVTRFSDEMIVDPLVRYLETRGVQFHLNASMDSVHVHTDQKRVQSIEVQGCTIEADTFVFALGFNGLMKLHFEESVVSPYIPNIGNLRHISTVHSHHCYVKLDVDPKILTSTLDTLRVCMFPESIYRLLVFVYWKEFQEQEQCHWVLHISSQDVTDQSIYKLSPTAQAKLYLKDIGLYDILSPHILEVVGDQGMVQYSKGSQYVQYLREGAPRIFNENNESCLVNEVPLIRPAAGEDNYFLDYCTVLPNLFIAGDGVKTAVGLCTVEGSLETARNIANAMYRNSLCVLSH
jgi:uncharacterized protein with NAD-binding domain and iron-sulfur cluster